MTSNEECNETSEAVCVKVQQACAMDICVYMHVSESVQNSTKDQVKLKHFSGSVLIYVQLHLKALE